MSLLAVKRTPCFKVPLMTQSGRSLACRTSWREALSGPAPRRVHPFGPPDVIQFEDVARPAPTGDIQEAKCPSTAG
jgi:hypothetical protein